jgi:GT2 family glycosyltransferase
MVIDRISSVVGPPGDGYHPTVSIVSVNYNGLKYLRPFLESLRVLDYPSKCYHVVLVDNASADGSPDIVRAQFPEVRIVNAPGNLGFAGGCNLGIRISKSDYVALVNNDTVVDRMWLRPLVEVAESDRRIGLVGSKMLFLTPFLDLGLEAVTTDPDPVDSEARAPALLLHEARVIGCDYDKVVFRAGHFSTGTDSAGKPVHVLGSSARVAVPVAHRRSAATLLLKFGAAPPRDVLRFRIMIGDSEIERLEVTREPSTVRLDLSEETVERVSRNMINNAGTRIDGEGRFGDRGIWEFDQGQYDLVSDMPALCGASVLLRRAMLDRLGGFDTRYFMYFEDVDLSWRASRDGWRLVYTPDSRLHHVHSGSSQEGSPLWIFYVTRNHLFWLIKHGARRAAARAVGAFYLRALRAASRRFFRPRAPSLLRDTVDVQVARSLTRHLAGLLLSRFQPPESGARGRWTSVAGNGRAEKDQDRKPNIRRDQRRG